MIARMKSVQALALLVLGAALTARPAPAQRVDVEVEEGTNMAVALSPDGSELAFDLQGTLWIRELEGRATRQLTDGLGDDRQPAWSPDGRRLVFQSYRDGNWHIWAIDRDGRNLKQLTRGPSDDREPAFASDGARVVFSSDRSGNYDLWELDLDDGRQRQLTRDPADDFGPAYSPDGARIAFVSRRDPAGIWLLERPADDDTGARLFAGAAGNAAGPSWDPSGERLAWQVEPGAQGRTGLVVARLLDGATEIVSRPEADVFPFRAAWRSPSELLYTADGRILTASLDSDERGEVPFSARMLLDRGFYPRRHRDLDGTGERPLRGIRSPAVSPDGKRVAFAALGDLWLREPSGALTRLTDDPWVELTPRWLPDGSALVFSADRDGSMDVWVHELADGSERKLLAAEGGALLPVVSPDGKKLAFYAAQPANPLGAMPSVLDLNTNEVEALLDRPVPPTELSWTGDSRHVALTVLEPDSRRFREGAYTLHVLGPSRGQTRSFHLAEPHSLAHAVYAPDGRRLAIVADGVLSVVDVTADGTPLGEPRAVTDELADWPSWGADSRALVYLSNGILRRLELGREGSDALPVAAVWKMPAPSDRLVVHAGRLFDGTSPGYRENVDIVVVDGRIEAVEAHAPSRHRGDWIDAGDRVVMPGLFEMHAHESPSLGEALGRTWLAFGVTSVRDPGSDAYDALERREAWASGRRLGPRAFVTGRLVDGGRVYYSIAEGISSFTHLAQVLERAQRLDYDFLKTYVRLPDELQRRATAVAHDLGIPVSSHEIYPAAAYGVDAVEHLGGTSRRGYSPKITALGRSYDDVVQIIARSGMNLTPTMVLPCYFLQVATHPELFENRQYRAFYGDGGGAARLPPGAGGGALAERCAAMGETVQRIVAEGGRVTAGTDSPFVPYGFGLQVELQLLVAAGLEPWQALRSATLWAAQAVGVDDDLGSVEPGKLADLVIVDGDPLAHIEDSLAVETTILGGRAYPIETLLVRPGG